MTDPTDPVGAFIPGPRATLPHAAGGPLAGLTFAVKDLFDIAGSVTTYGNPDWAADHGVAPATAPAVLALAEAGARFLGKTKTVELAYGLTGENVHHGTPINPKAPDRFPGGSSCGSVAAVAAGLVDAALGSDTGGSVRIPASYCGVFGIRPSWGAVSLAGAAPLAPSFDTAGWFARDAATLRRVGEVLLPGGGEGPLGPLIRIEEVWDNADPATVAALTPALAAAERALGPAMRLRLMPDGLDPLFDAFRAVQAEEAWASLGGWITRRKPRFGPNVGERFALARDLDPALAAAGRAFRRGFAARLRALVAGGAVLAYPTAPGPAPRIGLSLEEEARLRSRTLRATAIAGFAGLCEVSIPAGRVDGAPVGLSFTAAAGRDRALLAWVAEMGTSTDLAG